MCSGAASVPDLGMSWRQRRCIVPALDWEGPGGKGPCLRLPQAVRASARVREAAGVCAYPAQAPPPGGNGGGAAASGSAAGDDLYGAGMGVPAMEMKRPRLRVSAKPGPRGSRFIGLLKLIASETTRSADNIRPRSVLDQSLWTCQTFLKVGLLEKNAVYPHFAIGRPCNFCHMILI